VKLPARHRWLTPVILATQEAEIRRVEVRSQPGEIVHKTLSGKYLTQKRAGKSPEFKPQYNRKKKKKDITKDPTNIEEKKQESRAQRCC
jgi:predicted transcriptional regulator